MAIVSLIVSMVAEAPSRSIAVGDDCVDGGGGDGDGGCDGNVIVVIVYSTELLLSFASNSFSSNSMKFSSDAVL